jgi:diguanylate cyclase (GGDEF)-like protein
MQKSTVRKIGYFYIAFFIFYFAWYIFRPGGTAWLKIFSNTVYFIPLILSLITLVAVSLKTANKERLFWVLVLSGTLLYLFGDIVFSYYDMILNKKVPAPSIADIGYIGFYFPIFIASLIAYSQAREKSYLALTINSIILILVIFVFSWNTILLPLIKSTSIDFYGILSNFSYPVGDLTILSLLILLFYNSYRKLSNPLFYFVLSFGALAIGDSIYFYTVVNNLYFSGHPVDLYWVAGFLLLSMSAIERLSAKEWIFKHKKTPAHELNFQIFIKDRVPLILAAATSVYIFFISWRGIFSSVNLSLFILILVTSGIKIGMNFVHQSYLLKEHELLSIIDKQSGLYSRHYFKQRLKTDILRSIRLKTSLSLIFMSIKDFNNKFKKFSYEKNLVFTELAKSIKNNTRVYDIQACFDDDTFAVILFDSDYKKAYRIVNRINEQLSSALPEFLMDKLMLSVGIADFPKATIKKELLLNCAVSAMNEALKEVGGKIIYYGDIGKME